MLPINIISAIGSIFGNISKYIFVDKTEKLNAETIQAKLQAGLEALNKTGDLEKIIGDNKNELAAIAGHFRAIANESGSSDKWTSRARPSIIYYTVLFCCLAVPYGVLYHYNKGMATDIITGMKLWFNAIPHFIQTGFLIIIGVYVTSRSVIDKWLAKK